MKRAILILGTLLALPSGLMAQPLPTLPPAGYDQSGRFPAGTIQWNVSYYSSVAGSNLTMHVYTPPGYTPGRKYGVVYCYQGIGVGADTMFADWSVFANRVADNLIGEGKIKPVIIVALNNQFAGTYSDVNGMTIIDAIPFVDANYSTYADANHRGLYGYSWGGGHAFNVGCGNLDTFSHIAPSSSAPSKSSDATLFPNGGAEAKQKLKTLLIACGTADGLYGTSEGAHNYCVANNIPHAWWPIAGAGHWANEVWRPHLWNFLQMADAAGISEPPLPRSAYAQNEAEDSDQRRGVTLEACSEGGQNVGTIQSGEHVAYNNVDFGTGAVSFNARVASATSGGTIEVRLGSTNGTLIGSCPVSGTGGGQTWTTVSCAISGATGIQKVYLRFTGGSGYLFNVNWWQFTGPSSPVAIPPVPSGLVASPGKERAVLRWNTSGGATRYNVKRSTASGGPYNTLASVAGTNYTDTAVIGGTAYYYVLSALSLGGESADSGQAGVIPTVNVPSPWLTRDIGAVGLAGGANFTNGVFTVTGSGADIWGASDAFRFVHVPVTGDCTIIARVASLESHINAWSKAGVMIRESLNTNAVNAFIALTPGNGVTFQSRSTTGGNSSNATAGGVAAPRWVRLVRSGNTLTGSYSSDGVNWTQLGSTTLTMASTVYIGLAITGHNACTLCSATFDHVTAPGWAPPEASTPSGLVAAAGNEKVTLTWLPSGNATSYNVKRATTSGGPYTTIATVTTTNFTDTFVIGRTIYYYVVSALNSLAGESSNSAQASATPTVNVPLPWMTRDIGTVGLSGGAGFTNGVFTVSGSGDDIWNAADAFRFLYLASNSANFTVTARVASLQNVNVWSKAGVMIRASLDANAANAMAAVTPGNGVTWQYRSTVGGNTANAATSGLTAPYWIRLVRNGDTFTGYRSPNGTSWTQIGSTTLTNITTAYIGLAVTSHNNSALCTATFDNVSLPGWPPPLQAVTTIPVSPSQISLTWDALPNATSYNVKRSATSGGPYTPIATGLTATNHTDTGLAGGTMYYYVVSAIVSGAETGNSGEAAAATVSPTLGPLVHRYSFDETGGASAADSVGGPVWAGALPSGGSLASGQLTLASASSQYLALPVGIVSPLNDFTIETWVRLNSTTNWSRIFDFGQNTTTNMFLTPQNGGDSRLRFAITTGGNGGEQQINGSSALAAGVWHHVAVTLNGNTGILYLNGAPAGTNSGMTLRPSNLGNAGNNYVGKSQYPDPYLNGAVDEFRIYSAALSANEIAATYALGPGQVLSTNQPSLDIAADGDNLNVTWPLANAGFTLQSCTNLALGDWVNVASPDPHIVSNRWQVVLPTSTTTASAFYRLIQ